MLDDKEKAELKKAWNDLRSAMALVLNEASEVIRPKDDTSDKSDSTPKPSSPTS
jgi:hypothetical protein